LIKKGFIFGILIGAVNGLLGAGGGMLTVPILKKMGFPQKSAHRNAVAVILPITLLSAALYLFSGRVKILDAVPFIPAGLLGAAVGTVIIGKISPTFLKKAFAVFMIYSGIRMFF
jgi:uncharacterized membrane protein YfcA